jgi:hypothetical protein
MDEQYFAKRSFAELMHNPRRQQAKNGLSLLLKTFEENDKIDRAILAEVLFELLRERVIPKGPMTRQSAATWMSQLQRFRDDFDGTLQILQRPHK